MDPPHAKEEPGCWKLHSNVGASTPGIQSQAQLQLWARLGCSRGPPSACLVGIPALVWAPYRPEVQQEGNIAAACSVSSHYGSKPRIASLLKGFDLPHGRSLRFWKEQVSADGSSKSVKFHAQKLEVRAGTPAGREHRSQAIQSPSSRLRESSKWAEAACRLPPVVCRSSVDRQTRRGTTASFIAQGFAQGHFTVHAAFRILQRTVPTTQLQGLLAPFWARACAECTAVSRRSSEKKASCSASAPEKTQELWRASSEKLQPTRI